MNKKRIQWIDSVRGISILLIIIGHTYTKGLATNLIYGVNVPIFFVLSGYLTRKKSIGTVAKHGIRTLLIPYIFTSTAIIILSWGALFLNIPGMIRPSSWYQYILATIYGIGTSTRNSIFPNIYIPAIGAIWFLLSMYFANIIYQVLWTIVDQIKFKRRSIVFAILSIALSALGFFISEYVQLPWSISASLISIPFYVAGHYMHEMNLLRVNNYTIIISVISLMLWVLSAFSGPFWFNRGFSNHPVISMVGAIGGSFWIMFIVKVISGHMSLQITSKLGRLALITLSFHIICLNSFNDVGIIFNRLILFGIGVTTSWLIIDVYRIIICVIFTFMLAKSILVRKIFAIR